MWFLLERSWSERRRSLLTGVGTVALGMLIGAMVAFLPLQLAFIPISLLACLLVVLLWALPELPAVPIRFLRPTLHVFIVVLLCLPPYMAIALPGMPWVSVRRLVLFSMLLMALLSLAGSLAVRRQVKGVVAGNGALVGVGFAFFLSLVLSVPFSQNIALSFKGIVDVLLSWYGPFLCVLLAIRTHGHVIQVFRTLVVCLIVVVLFGVAEFILERNIFISLVPTNMLAENPILDGVVFLYRMRNMMYRATSTFLVPLTFGEFIAMVFPVALYFIFYGRGPRDIGLGILGLLMSVAGLVTSGARGGFVSALVAAAVFSGLYCIRLVRWRQDSLFGPFLLSIYPLGMATMLGAVFLWRRLYNMVLGGGDTAASTSARFIQWEMGWPHILHNPLFGHGLHMGAVVVGYRGSEEDILTIDSYVLKLLVECGVPGLLSFFSFVMIAIILGTHQYLGNRDARAAAALPFVAGLTAFLVYRLALAQNENHIFLFILLGLWGALYTLLVQDPEKEIRSTGTTALRAEGGSHARPLS